MKTQKILIVTIILLFLVSCTRIPNDYEKYQTFDEYALKGVKSNGKLQQPFVAVKYGKDTITVLICKDFRKKIKVEYINKGNYWYNLYTYKVPYIPNCLCDTNTIYYDKFIFNDTIITYEHSFLGMENTSREFSERLNVETKRYNISCSMEYLELDRNDKNNRFFKLKQYVDLYKDSILPHSVGYYQSFERKEKKDNQRIMGEYSYRVPFNWW